MRKLPILKSLHLFEAVSEFPSFSRAAERLNMTTGAVSYQMRLLEDWFGRRLFVRHSSGVRLTSDGEQLKRSCASAFTMLEKGCYELRRSDGGRSVVVGCSTTFLSHGLLPRIGRFRQLYQDIDFVFETDADLDALAVGAVDVLFVSGLLKRPLPVREVHVSNEMIGPVCAPAMLETIKSPADILSIPLLHEAARMDGWNEWASAAAICLQGSRLVVFDTFPWLSRQQKVGLAPQYLRKFWFEATLRRENLWLRLALRRSIAQSTCLSMGTREIWRLLKSLNDGSCQKYSVRIRYRLCRLQLERSSGPLSIRLRPMRASKR